MKMNHQYMIVLNNTPSKIIKLKEQFLAEMSKTM